MKSYSIALGLFWIGLAITLLVTQISSQPTIEIKWETESEFNTAGFNILRSDSPEGNFARLNNAIIPASDDPIVGRVYIYNDTDVEVDKVYYYRLEDVEYDNSLKQHEVIEAKVDSKPLWLIVTTVLSFIAGLLLIAESARYKLFKSRVR